MQFDARAAKLLKPANTWLSAAVLAYAWKLRQAPRPGRTDTSRPLMVG